jgi:DNA-binding NarL/FixJ family response regulator
MNTIDDLTKQEISVLALVAQGWRTAKIAQELNVSPRTVETHLSHIFQKLNISSRTEAAIYAFESGLFSKPSFLEAMNDKREWQQLQ